MRSINILFGAAAAVLLAMSPAGETVAQTLDCNDPLVGSSCPNSQFQGWTETGSTGGEEDRYWSFCAPPENTRDVCEYVSHADGTVTYTAINPGGMLTPGITSTVDFAGDTSSSLLYGIGTFYNPDDCGGNASCELAVTQAYADALAEVMADPLWRDP
jgi:hypothetical protein